LKLNSSILLFSKEIELGKRTARKAAWKAELAEPFVIFPSKGSHLPGRAERQELEENFGFLEVISYEEKLSEFGAGC
jgi:hypothetical protein